MITVYETRTSRAWCLLDNDHGHFTTNNEGDTLGVITGYCLDAPEQIPAGSMRNYGKNDPLVLQSIAARDDVDYILSLDQQRQRAKLAARLIAELNAEGLA